MEENKEKKVSKIHANSKKIKKVPVEPVEKPIEKKKSDIDDIFNIIKGKPKNKPENIDEVTVDNSKIEEPPKKKKKVGKDKPKYTEEGYKVYSFKDLKIGKGGGTALCPFDCDCCF